MNHSEEFPSEIRNLAYEVGYEDGRLENPPPLVRYMKEEDRKAYQFGYELGIVENNIVDDIE